MGLMGLADLSRDALRSLADLRKSVTDETAKLSDATRQLAAAVAGAVAIGLGLIATRLITSANPWLIIGVMVVAAAYVAAVVASGWQFVTLQRRLREDWQPHLYRFLPEPDYERMVTRPAKSAERTFFWGAGLGALAIVVLVLAVLIVSLAPEEYIGLKRTSDGGGQPPAVVTNTPTPSNVEGPVGQSPDSAGTSVEPQEDTPPKNPAQ